MRPEKGSSADGIVDWIKENTTPNAGFEDRIIRFVAGILIFAVAAFLGPAFGKVYLGFIPLLLGIIGLLVLATSFTGFCPVYRYMGMHTLEGRIYRDPAKQAEKPKPVASKSRKPAKSTAQTVSKQPVKSTVQSDQESVSESESESEEKGEKSVSTAE